MKPVLQDFLQHVTIMKSQQTHYCSRGSGFLFVAFYSSTYYMHAAPRQMVFFLWMGSLFLF